MDNIIVNSALWYAEQSSQFLLNSGANKLLDKGYDYYVNKTTSRKAMLTMPVVLASIH